MRVLLASDEPAAQEAVDLFTFRTAREAGALISSMGGFDGIVFTAGIGENAPAIRAAVVDRLRWTGMILDADANAGDPGLVSAESSNPKAWVIGTNEEAMIAKHAAAALASAAGVSQTKALPD